MFGPHLDRIDLSPPQQAMRERMRRHVDMLSSLIGPRHVGKYDMLLAAQRYVELQLSVTGIAVQKQIYEVAGKAVANLIVEQRGRNAPDQVVVLGAHYDSVNTTPGADDNASAVAGLIEIAQQLSHFRFGKTIRYVAFVNEEPPFYKTDDMGSLRYARQCRDSGDKIIGMINLEMIGYFDDRAGSQLYPFKGFKWLRPKRGNFIVICSDFGSAWLLARVARGFRRSVKFPMLPFPSPRKVIGPDMSDHWPFRQCGFPAVMVTDTSFLRNRHYHKPSDRLETLNLSAMTRVVVGVAGALARWGGQV